MAEHDKNRHHIKKYI